MFEAVWQQGKIIPRESVDIKEYARLLVIVADEKDRDSKKAGWRELKGKYKGKLSTVGSIHPFQTGRKGT
jgi:hypothetical protein